MHQKSRLTQAAVAQSALLARLPSPPGLLQRAIQSLTFVRYIPGAKLQARLALMLRHKLKRVRPVAAVAECEFRSAAPRALFPAREASARKDADGWTFTLLNKKVKSATLQRWRLPGQNQLETMTLNYMEYLEALPDDLLIEVVQSWMAYGFSALDDPWRDIWNSYAASLRAIVWMQQAARPTLDPDFRLAMGNAAAAHVAFVEQNLELDLGGNHLIKNIKALLWGSAAFEGAAALRWRQRGTALLAQAIEEQVLPDGVHAERSASYHAQVFADFLEIRHALGFDPLDGALDRTLGRMAQVVADLAHPDGFPVQFNDSGLTMAYRPATCLEIYERVYAIDRPDPQPVFDLAYAGYSGARFGDDFFACDFGPIGPNDLPGHGHSDVGSFEWSVGGRRIIVDQGVYEYVEGARRRVSKAAAAHNTLSIAGYDQADFFGAFRCGRRPKILERRFEKIHGGFALEGRHNGWSHAPKKPAHFRRFEYTNGDLEIIDELSAQQSEATIAFLLHPDVEAKITSDGFSLFAGKVQILAQTNWRAQIEDASWWPDLGKELPTTRIVLFPNSNGGVSRVRLRPISR